MLKTCSVTNLFFHVRLDFLDFELDGGSAEDKPCDRDSMEIFSAGTSELGMNKLCGKNDEQHIYIPVESVQVRVNIHDICMFINFNNSPF